MRTAKIPMPGSGARKSSTSTIWRRWRRAKSISASNHADQAAVKRHAAFPDAKIIERIFDEALEAIEQHPADAPAENHAQRAVENEVVDIGRLPGRTRLRGAPAASHQATRKGDDIRQPVPADRRGARETMTGSMRSRWRGISVEIGCH